MDKIQLNQYIESICNQIPIVHSFYTDDVYECWNTDEVKYGSVNFVITSSSISEDTTTWSGLIYFADRLLENRSNRDMVQSDAINVINAVMNAIAMDEDIVSINYPTNVELFEQEFTDVLAGGYANIQITTSNSISKCGYGYLRELEGCDKVISELEDDIKELEGENAQLSEQVTNLNAENDRLGGENDRLSEQVTNLNAENDRLESNLESVTNDYENLKGDYDQLEGENGRLSEQVTNLNAENDRLESNLESVTNDYENLKGDYGRLEESVESLKTSAIDFVPIDYTPSDIKGIVDYYNNGVDRAKELIDYWDTNTTPDYNTMVSYSNYGAFKDIVYAPKYDFVRYKSNGAIFGKFEAHDLFRGCHNLQYVPDMDLSPYPTIDFENAFEDCFSLIKLPIIKGTHKNLYYAFRKCYSLIDASNLQYWGTGEATDFNSCFTNCESLKEIPYFDTHSATVMSYMFSYCSSLTSIPQLDTSKVTTMSQMFYNCSSLQSLPLLDFSSVTSISSFFGYSNITTLTDLGGFTGLKVNFDGLNKCPNLTVESLLNVFNTIADVNGTGTKTLTIGSTNLNKLTDEQKAIATNKGWTLK